MLRGPAARSGEPRVVALVQALALLTPKGVEAAQQLAG